jgi:hypothetical protein
MSDTNKKSPSNANSVVIAKDSGRSLPVTSTATPMPPVKPPKPAEGQQKK